LSVADLGAATEFHSLRLIKVRVKKLPDAKSLAGPKALFRSAVNAFGEILHASGYGGHSFRASRRPKTSSR